MDLLLARTFVNRNKIYKLLKNETEWHLLNGQVDIHRPQSDCEYDFKQDASFYWLTGVYLANCKVLINGSKKEIILVTPEYGDFYKVWCGKVPNFDQFKFTRVITKEEYEKEFTNLNESNKLREMIVNQRVIKNEHEIELMRRASKISSKVHNMIVNEKESFIGLREKHISDYFTYHTARSDDNVRGIAYPTIVGSGTNSAILHYVSNDKVIKDNDLVLIDAGCEYMGYASDITITFCPTIMSNEQKAIYDIVVKCNKECTEMIKEGILYTVLSVRSDEIIYEGLDKLGLINKEKQKEKGISNSEVVKIFMPHGLGHHLGLDVHDCGSKVHKKLKTEPLKENMVVTVEPGIYFIDALLEKNKEVLTDEVNKYKYIGGVRIEDDIVVKKDGYEKLSNVYR